MALATAYRPYHEICSAARYRVYLRRTGCTRSYAGAGCVSQKEAREAIARPSLLVLAGWESHLGFI